MIAWMPPSASPSSATLKPSRVSISSWLRIRSAPLRPMASSSPSPIMADQRSAISTSSAVRSPPPASSPPPSIAAHSAARPSSPPAAAPVAAAARRSSAEPPCGAPLSVVSFSAMAPGPLLNDDFLEQDPVDLVRPDGQVDATQQLLLQSVDAGRALEVVCPQLAQVDLESVEHPRQDRRQGL